MDAQVNTYIYIHHMYTYVYICLCTVYLHTYIICARISFLTASLNFAGWTHVFFCCVQFEIRNFVSSSLIGSWTRQGGMTLDVDWWTEIPSEKRKLRWRRRCDAAKLMSFYLLYAWKKNHVWGDGLSGWQDGKIGVFFCFLILDRCFRHLLIVINGNLEWEILEMIIAIAFCRSIESQASTEIWFVKCQSS